MSYPKDILHEMQLNTNLFRAGSNLSSVPPEHGPETPASKIHSALTAAEVQRYESGLPIVGKKRTRRPR